MKIGNNKNPKGKLYTKYFNSVRNLKLNGLIESTSAVCKAKSNDNSKDCSVDRCSWTQTDFGKTYNISIINIPTYIVN